MASIYKIKESELIGGTSNDDLYPVTSTQAIYSQGSDGSKPYGVAKILEDRLQEGEQSLNNLSDKTYRKSETYNRQEIDNRINTVRTGLFVVVDDLPDASVDTLGKIYLVQGTGDTKQEYITVNNGTSAQPDYDWENIGSTSIDLENYSTTEEIEAALDALRDELLEDITDLGNAVYTKDEVYNKAEITEQFNNVAQFKPEWAPNGQLPEPNIATTNRLFLLPKANPDKLHNNIADEYITVMVDKYGPLGSWEGGEGQTDTSRYEYRWEKLGSGEGGGGLVYSVNEKIGNVVLTAEDVGALPIDTPIPAAQVNSDWDADSGVAQILNKPTIPDISRKADKVAYGMIGNFTELDSEGNLTDSGKKASDFATAAQGAKADSAIQYDGGTENSSGVTNVAVTIEDTTYYTTNTIYTLNPEESIRYICESVNHNTYIIDADANPKTLLVESNYGEVRFSNTTDSVMHVQGACIQNGDTFTVEISRMGLKDVRMHIVETSTTNLIAQVNTLYRFSTSVSTLAITLPVIKDTTHTHEIEFLLFMGDNPSVTFTAAGGYGVRVQKDLVLSSLGTYELNAMWTGGYWLVAGIKLDQLTIDNR